jgi:hypothetical protein
MDENSKMQKEGRKGGGGELMDDEVEETRGWAIWLGWLALFPHFY